MDRQLTFYASCEILQNTKLTEKLKPLALSEYGENLKEGRAVIDSAGKGLGVRKNFSEEETSVIGLISRACDDQTGKAMECRSLIETSITNEVDAFKYGSDTTAENRARKAMAVVRRYRYAVIFINNEYGIRLAFPFFGALSKAADEIKALGFKNYHAKGLAKVLTEYDKDYSDALMMRRAVSVLANFNRTRFADLCTPDGIEFLFDVFSAEDLASYAGNTGEQIPFKCEPDSSAFREFMDEQIGSRIDNIPKALPKADYRHFAPVFQSAEEASNTDYEVIQFTSADVFDRELAFRIAKFNVNNIDIISLMEKHQLSVSTVTNICKLAFAYNGNRFNLDNDLSCKAFLAAQIVSSYFETILMMSASSQAAPVSKKAKDSDFKKQLILTEKQNAELKNKLKAAEGKESTAVKDLQRQIKNLKGELHDKDRMITELEEELERHFEEEVATEQAKEMAEQPVKEATEEMFMDIIKEKKLLIWGLRDTLVARYSKKYPEVSFVDSDHNFAPKEIKQYDMVIIKVDYTTHAKYWALKDMIKASGIPSRHVLKGQNNEMHIWEACVSMNKQIEGDNNGPGNA